MNGVLLATRSNTTDQAKVQKIFRNNYSTNDEKRRKMKIIDTFPEFKQVWQNSRNSDLQAQLEAWEKFYSSRYPEIFHKIVRDYEIQNMDWKGVALDRVFPILNERFEQIDLSYENLTKVINRIMPKIHETTDLRIDPVFVIYVGIGTGAGWATEYKGDLSILFGLENIAELGWSEESALEGLVSHEAGHLYQISLRKDNGIPVGSGPLWDLYEEGFAEHFESIALGAERWHQSAGQHGWLEWCSRNIKRLSRIFLEDMKSSKGTQRFFGSWYDLEGWKETGYFLGGTIMRMLNLPLENAALLTEEDVRKKFTAILIELAEN